jgi:hypothetical protein
MKKTIKAIILEQAKTQTVILEEYPTVYYYVREIDGEIVITLKIWDHELQNLLKDIEVADTLDEIMELDLTVHLPIN